MIPLMFPPACSPTYVPLGVSLLKGYIDARCGTGKLSVMDLNIPYWNRLADRKSRYGEYLRFIRGGLGAFDRTFYESHRSAGERLKADSDRVLHWMRRYLDKGVMDEGLEDVFIHLGGAATLLVEPEELLRRAPWIEGVFTGEGEKAL